MDSLQQIKDKLEYILQKKQNTLFAYSMNANNKHQNVVLDFYINDIKNSIQEIADKIEDIHNEVTKAEESHNGYTTLYEQLVKQADGDRAFINTFGPYMILSQLYLDVI